VAKSVDSVEKKLKDFVALMRETYNIYAVVLYGSYAAGRANDDSDIDVAVFSDDFGNDPYEEMKALCVLPASLRSGKNLPRLMSEGGQTIPRPSGRSAVGSV